MQPQQQKLTIFSYQIFLSSILGVAMCDYYLVKKGYINVPDLFTSSKNGNYYYTYGFNWRAYTAYLAGIIPCFPGFLDNVGVKGIPKAAVRIYYLALVVGIFVAAGVYYALNWWKPPPGGMTKSWNEQIDVVNGEAYESQTTSDVEIANVSVGDKDWDRREKL